MDEVRHTWLQAAARWLRETTHKADHKNDAGKLRWLEKYLSPYCLDEITRDVVDVVIQAKRREAGPSTVNRYLALVRAILRMARDDWEWIQRVPRIRMLKEPPARVRWLPPLDAVRLLSELPPHLRSMAVFALATGLRQSNVTRLRWDQVDLQRGMAWIHAKDSKNRKAFPVPLNADAMAILRSQMGVNREWVFIYRGKPVGRTSTRAWKLAKERAGIVDFRWHDLRHTWASWHAQNGTGLRELMDLGSWSTIQMVLRYAHLGGDHLKVPASHIEGILSAASARY